MSSIIGYRKEFEDIILKGKLEEALKSLVPNSSEHIYLEFCEEYKKCCEEKKISPELNQILEKAKSKRLSNKLIQVLETKRDLLEYDLPSTPQDKKDKIIDELYKHYCGTNLNHDAPFFVREKKSKDGQKKEAKNSTPIELTEKIIKESIDREIKKNERDKKYVIRNTPESKRHKIFLELLGKDDELCMDIIYNRIKILFYLMTKDEFTKVIEFFNRAKKDLGRFDYNTLTVEQIERLLKEVKNEMYVNKQNLVSFLMNKKYNKLLKKAKNKNDLNKVKEILKEIYEIYKIYTPELTQSILCMILSKIY